MKAMLFALRLNELLGRAFIFNPKASTDKFITWAIIEINHEMM
jgi:hypothetical protein